MSVCVNETKKYTEVNSYKTKPKFRKIYYIESKPKNTKSVTYSSCNYEENVQNQNTRRNSDAESIIKESI